MPEDRQTTPPFDHWAILEIFGHTRLAGRVSEGTIGGNSFVRVDVPPVGEIPGYTRFYGQGAIYSITLVDEATARAAAETLAERPVTVYIHQFAKRLDGPREWDDEEEDDA